MCESSLTIQRFLLSGSMNRLVRLVYIGAVVNAREILLQLKRPFFVTKKTFFSRSLRSLMQGRKRANYAGKWSIHGAK